MPASAVVRFHPGAGIDLHEAEGYYAARSEQAADNFWTEVQRGLALIREAPQRWPFHRRGTRRLALRRFPFSIIYRLQGSIVYVVAVAHARRRPDYWRGRL